MTSRLIKPRWFSLSPPPSVVCKARENCPTIDDASNRKATHDSQHCRRRLGWGDEDADENEGKQPGIVSDDSAFAFMSRAEKEAEEKWRET
jgi:hypothetical protein